MLTGDVLLVKGIRKVVSSALVAAQKVIYKNSVSSHVEFGLGDGTFVHATSDGGVHVTFILDELKQCEEGWRAIRLKGISDKQQEELMKAGLFYLRQDYNKLFMGEGSDHSSFCSELVAKIYKDAQIPILGEKLPSKVAPAHFDEQADILSDWVDVTNEYIERLKEIEADPSPYEFACNTIQMTMAKRHFMSKKREEIFAAMEVIAEKDGNIKLKNTVEQAKQLLREKRSLHFWDEKDQE